LQRKEHFTPEKKPTLHSGHNMKSSQTLTPALLPFLSALILAASLSSCTTIHGYQTGGPRGREQGNQPGTEWESRPSNTFLWGAIRQDVFIDNCKLGDGSRINIEEFKIEKKAPHILATVLTLGLWEPMRISWRCAKPKN
jgi:hypothetical protein